ncbi:MAG: hypothetical protein HY644_09420 [Acidobacteria bacterium]|nr:hypothetical protein [Acidobacteriota bacterium]
MDLRKFLIVGFVMSVAFVGLFSQQKKAPARAKRAPVGGVKAEAPVKPKTTAERISDILQEFVVQADLRNHGKNPPQKVVRLSEEDVNAYMRQAIKTKSRYGVTSVYVKLIGPDYVGATTTIDFAKVQVEDQSLAVRMVRSLLSGEKQIYVEGSIACKDGKGQFKLEKAYFASVRLPVYFIDKVIHYLGRRQNPPVDTSQPAALPYGLKRVEISAGSILLVG